MFEAQKMQKHVADSYKEVNTIVTRYLDSLEFYSTYF
jgi:hypothetical protein